MAFGVCMNCLSSFPPSAGKKWKFLQNIFSILSPLTMMKYAGVVVAEAAVVVDACTASTSIAWTLRAYAGFRGAQVLTPRRNAIAYRLIQGNKRGLGVFEIQI